jgi:GNAT superfamily N-acetyltransferase
MTEVTTNGKGMAEEAPVSRQDKAEKAAESQQDVTCSNTVDRQHKADKVRKVRRDELGKLLELYRHLNPDDPDISCKDKTNQLWDEICDDPRQSILVLEEDGCLAASCTLVIVSNLTRGGRPYALIENVVTHGSFRRKGYGTAVLDKAVELAREKGCYKVMLLTGRKDEGVFAFYESAGFDRSTKTGFYMKL